MNIDDILSVDMTPLSSISTSVPDMSVATSVDRGTLMTVDFDDRAREIQDVANRSELDDTTCAYRRFRNPLHVSKLINLELSQNWERLMRYEPELFGG